MRITVYSARHYDRESLVAANRRFDHDLVFLDAQLDTTTASLAAGSDAVCVFVNDIVDATVLATLAAAGVRLIALRCAGFDNVDLAAAARHDIAVTRVPGYAPHAVAEFAIGLLLTLDRRIHRAWARVRENNFSLDSLVGRTLHGRVAGIIGTGEIGALVAKTLAAGFGCTVLASDPSPDPDLIALGVDYVPVETLMARSEIISLHCPLTPATRHLIDDARLRLARPDLLLVNTGRGGLIDTAALIRALKQKRIAGAALDVYEREAGTYFRDASNEISEDDVLQRLLTFPNVLITGHQAFLTEEALAAIAQTTLASCRDFAAGGILEHAVRLPPA